jgi:hypothetical protein
MLGIILAVLSIIFCILHRCCCPQCKVTPVIKACICLPCSVGRVVCGCNDTSEKTSTSVVNFNALPAPTLDSGLDQRNLAALLTHLENGRIVKRDNKIVIEIDSRERSPSLDTRAEIPTTHGTDTTTPKKRKRSSSIDSPNSSHQLTTIIEQRKRKVDGNTSLKRAIRGTQPFHVRALFPTRNDIC